MNEIQPKKGGNPTKHLLYAQVAKLADKAIKELDLLLSHNNENVRLGAVKTVLNKCIPDLKAVEVKDDNGKTLNVIVIPSELMNKYGIAVQTPPNTIASSDEPNQISSS